MIDSAGMLTCSISSLLTGTFFFSVITSDFTITEFAVFVKYFPLTLFYLGVGGKNALPFRFFLNISKSTYHIDLKFLKSDFLTV